MRRSTKVLSPHWLHHSVWSILILVMCLPLPTVSAFKARSESNFQQVSPCPLKNDLRECDVKSDELVVALPLDQELSVEITGGQRRVYRIDLVEGQFLQVVVDQLGIDLV